MGSKKSFLEIVNKTNLSMSIKVDGTDSYDWEGDSRPDKNFMNVTIPPNSSRKEREELNSKAKSAWFTMHITLSNGDKIYFRNDQQDSSNRIHRYYTLSGSDSEKYIACQMNDNNDNNYFIIFAFSLKNWMKLLPDETSLLNMSIPGTHESCALNDGWTMNQAKCQNWDLETQLNNGVRYLDIRGEVIDDSNGKSITISHGFIRQPYDLYKVLNNVKDFLEHNPEETVLLQLNQENSKLNTEEYAAEVDVYIKNKLYKDIIHLDQKNLTLEHVRGKIVLVNRFIRSNKYGINLRDWIYNDSFHKDNNVIKYNIQDVCNVCKATFELVRDRKMDFVNSFFSDYAFKKDELNLCFCSGSCPGGIYPLIVAAGDNGVNERTSRQHLQSKKNWNGVILFDFIDSYDSITIPYIINNNFKK